MQAQRLSSVDGTTKLHEQRIALEAAGVEYVIFDGVDHVGLVDDLDRVLPVVIEFLKRTD